MQYALFCPFMTYDNQQCSYIFTSRFGRRMLDPPNSRADKGRNCALYDTSMKFGKQLEDTIRKIFGYRAIPDFSCSKNGGRFQNGRHASLLLLKH